MNNIEAFRNPGKNINLSKFEYAPSRRSVFDSHANTSHVWNSNRVEFESARAMRKEVSRLIAEYSMCGMAVYASSRMCANWR